MSIISPTLPDTAALRDYLSGDGQKTPAQAIKYVAKYLGEYLQPDSVKFPKLIERFNHTQLLNMVTASHGFKDYQSAVQWPASQPVKVPAPFYIAPVSPMARMEPAPTRHITLLTEMVKGYLAKNHDAEPDDYEFVAQGIAMAIQQVVHECGLRLNLHAVFWHPVYDQHPFASAGHQLTENQSHCHSLRKIILKTGLDRDFMDFAGKPRFRGVQPIGQPNHAATLIANQLDGKVAHPFPELESEQILAKLHHHMMPHHVESLKSMVQAGRACHVIMAPPVTLFNPHSYVTFNPDGSLGTLLALDFMILESYESMWRNSPRMLSNRFMASALKAEPELRDYYQTGFYMTYRTPPEIIQPVSMERFIKSKNRLDGWSHVTLDNDQIRIDQHLLARILGKPIEDFPCLRFCETCDSFYLQGVTAETGHSRCSLMSA
ncbi:hypothetical protein [Alkanindiges hydrocarboniclasticus]|uniref:hypothetical protein n=1 Tax=Alkanindiges hydrocarboniclasticus TaxID=1907941 RepID=UPI001178704C|nr:hypothetical protein [Alkanindiges hydrocarboniclasticus]